MKATILLGIVVAVFVASKYASLYYIAGVVKIYQEALSATLELYLSNVS